MEIIREFKYNDKTLNVYGDFINPCFKMMEVCEILDIKNPHDAYSRIDDEWKIDNLGLPDSIGRIRKTNMITEPGLYYLTMRSDKEAAKSFQKWVCSDVLPTIRQTGQYRSRNKQISGRTTFFIQNEYDLHIKVVNFIFSHYPNITLISTLGENQVTDQMRIQSALKGYQKGSPDIIITNINLRFNGFCIEFKSPTGNGDISAEQLDMLEKYKLNGYKTMISNSYDDIIISIHEYMKGVRVCCDMCDQKFISSETLKTHKKIIHKIN